MVLAAIMAVVAVAAGLSAVNQRSASAGPDVFVHGGGPAFRGAAPVALAAASSRTGLPIPALKSEKYELTEIMVGDDLDGIRLPVQTVDLIYWRRDAEPGKGRLWVGVLTGRQSAVAAGRQVEPAPVPVVNAAGLEMVRADLGQSVGFTVWRDNATHHIVFEAPWPADAEMLAIVQSLFR